MTICGESSITRVFGSRVSGKEAQIYGSAWKQSLSLQTVRIAQAVGPVGYLMRRMRRRWRGWRRWRTRDHAGPAGAEPRARALVLDKLYLNFSPPQLFSRRGRLQMSIARAETKMQARVGPVLTCQVCGDTFRRREHLDRHRSRHTGAKPFICTVCNKAFTRR